MNYHSKEIEMIIEDKEPYEYRLTYINGDREVTHVFSAFINGEELRNNLRHFLLASSWSPASVDSILGEVVDE